MLVNVYSFEVPDNNTLKVFLNSNSIAFDFLILTSNDNLNPVIIKKKNIKSELINNENIIYNDFKYYNTENGIKKYVYAIYTKDDFIFKSKNIIIENANKKANNNLNEKNKTSSKNTNTNKLSIVGRNDSTNVGQKTCAALGGVAAGTGLVVAASAPGTVGAAVITSGLATLGGLVGGGMLAGTAIVGGVAITSYLVIDGLFSD